MVKNKVLIIFVLIAVTSVGFRLLGVNRPLVGNFSSRQVIYAMYARNFVEDGYDLLAPKADMLKGGQLSVEYADYPWVSFMVGLLYKMFGFNIDFCGRLSSVISYAVALILLFALSRRLFGNGIGIFASLFFAICPSSIIYGQSFLMDMPAVCLSIVSIYFALLWQKGKNRYLFISAIALMLGILLRVQVSLLLLPLFIIFLGKQDLKSIFTKLYFYIFVLIALGIPAIWFGYGYLASLKSDYAIGIISLTHNVYGRGFPDPLFFSPEFYKNVFDMFSGTVLGPFIFVLFLVGLFSKQIWSEFKFIGFWVVSVALLYFFTPLKLINLNYYALHIAVPACLIAAIMADVIWSKIKNIPYFYKRISIAMIVMMMIGASLRYSLSPALGASTEDKNMLKIARVADKMLPKNVLILTAYGTNPALLYYSHRKGWPFYIKIENFDPNSPSARSMFLCGDKLIFDSIKMLKERIEQGARYLVVADKNELDNNKELKKHIESNYSILFQDKDSVIFDLKRIGD